MNGSRVETIRKKAVATTRVDGVEFVRIYVKCGNKRCKPCRGHSLGHGPYWYWIQRYGNREFVHYYGKEHPHDWFAADPNGWRLALTTGRRA